jgi:hypothetical protein
MISKCPLRMMGFSMNIRSYRTAYGYEFGARNYGRKKVFLACSSLQFTY